MESYQPDWTGQPAETGLEEPMWNLGLGGRDSYPERPGESNCVHYMRTGSCGYGPNCRYNHPRDRASAAAGFFRQGGEYPEREGQPVCQYFMKTGTCKFGASCKYHHPKYGGGSLSPVPLNYSGYPLRPGEKECAYYIKTGMCKFGVTCKFHHPQPASVPAPAPAFYPSVQSHSVPSPQQYGGMVTNWQAARPSLLPGSYVQGTYGPVLLSPGVVPFSAWSPYPAPMSPVASPGSQPNVGAGPIYGVPQLSSPPTGYAGGPYQPLPSSAAASSSGQKENIFPERPGVPDCQYYMRTGDCKFGPSCKYHHPPERISSNVNYALSPMGLPLRPGAPTCTFYLQHGVCKFGPTCKFDHPMGPALSYSPSASSLADMPVAPYPIGSSLPTLAPSSSSSELRPEFSAGSSMDSFSTRIPSSGNISSGVVGSMFSKSGPSRSGVQVSGQGSGLRGIGTSGHGGDAHSSG